MADKKYATTCISMDGINANYIAILYSNQLT